MFRTEANKSALEQATTLEEVTQVALDTLLKLQENGHQIVEICGPISTGGQGSLEANLHFFKLATETAQKNGLIVFDLPFFQNAIIRVTGYNQEHSEYLWEILHVFFDRIFRSGTLSKALFLPGWQSSVGAKWERERLAELGILIEEYPEEWIKQMEQKITAG